jgi:hypothetical protein
MKNKSNKECVFVNVYFSPAHITGQVCAVQKSEMNPQTRMSVLYASIAFTKEEWERRSDEKKKKKKKKKTKTKTKTKMKMKTKSSD